MAEPVLDPAEPLPGEDPDSPFLDDAIHWISVYSELLSLKRQLLQRADQVLVGAQADTEREADADRDLLSRQAERYRRRLEFWRRRAKELAA
ncbi:MAG: hypothetical protein JOY80_04245 [Candidatus Dormibacteraeota bacterium]|nr:hypothetical protein [Candidatus Dormibacteraeota bacterium]